MFHKTVIVVLSLMCFLYPSITSAAEPADYTVPGRAAMFEGTLSGLRDAYLIFDDGLNDAQCLDCATDRELRFLHAITRTAMLVIRDDSGSVDSILEIAEYFDVELFGNYLNMLDVNYPDYPVNQHNAYEFPETAQDDANKISTFLDDVMIPELDAIIQELDMIGDSPADRFQLFFLPSETLMTNNLEVDYAEVLIFKGALTMFKGQLQAKQAYDLYIDADDMLMQKAYGGSFGLNKDLFDPHPEFLKVLPTANDSNDGAAILAQVREDWISGINYSLDAIDYMRNENNPPGTDPQEDEMLYVDPNDCIAVDAFVEKLNAIRNSLTDDTVLVYPTEVIKTYNIYNSSSVLIGELAVEIDTSRIEEGDKGYLTFINDGIAPTPWEVDTSYITVGQAVKTAWGANTGGEIMVYLERSEGGWAEGDFEGIISNDGNSITEATFEYWGPTSGMLTGLSGQITNTQIKEGYIDFNPIFASSSDVAEPRYTEPLDPCDLLPVFDAWNMPQPGTMGHGLVDDATLGGIIPDMNQYDWQISLDMQPGGLFYLDYIGSQQVAVDGNTDDWTGNQLIFSDISGDVEGGNGVEGVDIEKLYLALGWENLYGAITLHDNIGPGQRFYDLYMSYSPEEHCALDAIWFNINVTDGSAVGCMSYMTADDWEYFSDFDVNIGPNAVEFKVPFEDIPGDLYGRFITLESSGWVSSQFDEGRDENYTHLKIGWLGSITGQVDYDGYKGDPIFIQAYTDPKEPEESMVAATMITEPGPYTLEGIGINWQGYIRAFTPLFGFDNPFELETFDIQASVPVFQFGYNVDDVDIVLTYPVVLKKNIVESGEIDADTEEVDWYAFDALQGGVYTLHLDRGTADYACMSLYDRDGDEELVERLYWQTQQITWMCPISGRYYLEVANGYYLPDSWTYGIYMTTDVTCPDADIASAEGVGVKDCKVDFYDLGVLVSTWLNDCSEPFWCDGADFNKSESIDFTDFATLANEWMVNMP